MTVELAWEREDNPVWDADKARIAASAPDGALGLDFADGAGLPGDWFVAKDAGAVVGFGFLDMTWGGDAEITLVVDSARQGAGVGTFVMDHLEQEARSRGINYVHNSVRDTHPQRDDVHDWLLVRGYKGNESDPTLRKHVGEAGSGRLPEPSTTAAPSGSRSQGEEESGDYVDVEAHRF
ncbi:GNAT family N-acetyltransferase [Janibacter limosus]|uniref:GNAT family N-acetyltransferase n=1 Tax=Janibacter limosus TaxID=53458 RepID=UPI000830D4E1|nr:GNAT family N-acetyltransferase [Janibacter limosus]